MHLVHKIQTGQPWVEPGDDEKKAGAAFGDVGSVGILAWIASPVKRVLGISSESRRVFHVKHGSTMLTNFA